MKFSKPIVSAGKYNVPTEKGPDREETITANRLRHWALQHGEMVKQGLKIPAPWAHNGEGPLQIGSDGTLKSSKDNAGFWEKLWVDNGMLWGIVDVPSEEDAIKIGKSVQETSVFVRPKFIDGKGSEWEDSLMHIALVTHPVEAGQGNFVPEKDGLTLSMSQNTQMNVDITGNSSTLSLNEVLKKLREVAEIGLPENTTESNLIDRLMSALMQKEISDKDKLETGTTRRPPSKSVEQPSTVAIAMAFNTEQIKSIVDSKVINPKTSKEFTEVDLLKGNEPVTMSQTPNVPKEVENNPAFQSLKNSVGFLMSHTATLTKVGFTDRINALVSKGVISKDYVETNCFEHTKPIIVPAKTFLAQLV